jgi:hypothetical protein
LDDPEELVRTSYDRVAERHAEWASRTRTAERGDEHLRFDVQTRQCLIESAGMTIEHASVDTADEDGQPVSFLWIVARMP